MSIVTRDDILAAAKAYAEAHGNTLPSGDRYDQWLSGTDYKGASPTIRKQFGSMGHLAAAIGALYKPLQKTHVRRVQGLPRQAYVNYHFARFLKNPAKRG